MESSIDKTGGSGCFKFLEKKVSSAITDIYTCEWYTSPEKGINIWLNKIRRISTDELNIWCKSSGLQSASLQRAHITHIHTWNSACRPPWKHHGSRSPLVNESRYSLDIPVYKRKIKISLLWENPGKATHSNCLTWNIPVYVYYMFSQNNYLQFLLPIQLFILSF